VLPVAGEENDNKLKLSVVDSYQQTQTLSVDITKRVARGGIFFLNNNTIYLFI
jgi:hypothetical protein